MPPILFAVTALLVAQGGEARLDDLVQEALSRNPEIVAAQKQYESARQRPSIESSPPDPMVSLGYNSVGSPRPFAGIGRDPVANAGIMVSQMVPYPGKLRLSGAAASREAEAAFQGYRMARLSVVSRLKQAYYRLSRVYEALDVLARNRELLTNFLRISEARYSVGRGAQQDVFKAQTQLSILETRAARFEQERRSLEAEIASLLNRPPEATLGRPAAVEAPHPLPKTLDELLEAARREAPMLAREEKMIQRAQIGVDLARKEYYPDFTLNAGYYAMGSMGNMYMARVDFTLPLWFRRKQHANLAAETSELSRARHNYEAAGQTLNYRLRDDYFMAETSYRLLAMYGDTVLPQSRLALDSALASYQTGAVDFLTVLTNFMTVLDYELNRQEETLNYFLALARIEEMTGIDLAHK